MDKPSEFRFAKILRMNVQSVDRAKGTWKGAAIFTDPYFGGNSSVGFDEWPLIMDMPIRYEGKLVLRRHDFGACILDEKMLG